MNTESIPAILLEIGHRIQRERLNQNRSQAELSLMSGISRKTITNLENGDGCSLNTLLAILQGLDRLDHLDAFLPDPGISPIQLAKLQGKVRKRATGKRKTKLRKSVKYTDKQPRGNVVEETPAVWNWADEE